MQKCSTCRQRLLYGLIFSRFILTKLYKMERIKCATFNKKMQDSISREIREKMRRDRDNAEKEQESKAENLPIQNVSKCRCKTPNHWIKTDNGFNIDYCRTCNMLL